MKNLLSSMFKSDIEDVVYDLASGVIGIKRDQDVVTFKSVEVSVFTDGVESKEQRWRVVSSPFVDMAVPVKAFAMAVNIDLIDVGDIVLANTGKTVGLVTHLLDDGNVKVLLADGSVNEINPSLNMINNAQQLFVVKNLFNIKGFKPLGNVGDKLNVGEMDFNSMLPLLLMNSHGNGSGDSIDKLLPFMVMNGSMGNGMNPMMAMLLMNKDDSNIEDLLPLMMCMGNNNGTETNGLLQMIMMKELIAKK